MNSERMAKAQCTSEEYGIPSPNLRRHSGGRKRVHRAARAANSGIDRQRRKRAGKRETIFETIAANPLPTILIGVGFAWLLVNRARAAKRARGFEQARSDRGPDDMNVAFSSRNDLSTAMEW